ncbi:MAG TPA: DMT family transporter [Candidatus Acidoferrales bacterium]|nr:DMT family transporter [Candidatus Acidoferrales bacterium]
MHSGIFLGLTAALSWGVADFMARFASRRAGAYRTLHYMQFFGFITVTVCIAATGHWSSYFPAAARDAWAWAALAGLVNTFSGLALYRSFEVGVLALVAPIAASYPVLTVMLSLESGERLTTPHAVGVAAAILGVILAAVTFSSPVPSGTPGLDASGMQHRKRLLRGVPWALGAAVGFGFLFWVLGFRVMPVFGGFASVWLIRLTTFGTLTILVFPLRQSRALPEGSTLWLIAGIGFMDTAAFVANNLALKHAEVAIASVLSSLYGAVTVLLAAVFLREKLEKTQWAGVALIFLGIALVSM